MQLFNKTNTDVAQIESLLNHSKDFTKVGEIFADFVEMYSTQMDFNDTTSKGLETVLTLDYNKVYGFMDDFKCAQNFKQDVITIKEASKLLNQYMKFIAAQSINEYILFGQQFVDYCYGGKCYQSLLNLLSLFEDRSVNIF